MHTDTVALDESFSRDPLFGALIAALRPERRVRVDRDPSGAAVGAALLAGHEAGHAPASIDIEVPQDLVLPGMRR